MSLFPLVQILYWLSLSTWFGGVLFVSIAGPIIVSTLRQKMVLPEVLSVNLEGQHASLLSGTIMGNLLAVLFRIELACAAGLFVALLAQWFILGTGTNLLTNLLRSCLYVGAIIFTLYDRLSVWPKVWKSRQEYIDHADEPEIANAARERFDEHSRTSVTILGLVLFMLLGIVLFSGNLTPALTLPYSSPTLK